MTAPEPIRRATRADIPAMTRIVCDWEVEVPFVATPAQPEVIEPIIQDTFDARQMYVVGEPVDGYMSLDPVENKIGAIYLTRRGTGMGKRLIDLAKEGRDTLWLTVFTENTRAQAFYRREGFVVTGTIPATDAMAETLKMEWTR